MAFPPLEELLLLTAPMLWIDEIVTVTPDAVRCRLTPRATHPFVSDGEIDPLVALEWMSQAAACLAALNAHAAGASACARLLESVLEADFGGACFRSGEPLFIDAQLAPDGSFACGVMRGDQRLAGAVLRLRERSRDDAETAA